MNLSEAVQWLVQNRDRVLDCKIVSIDTKFNVRFTGCRLEVYHIYKWQEWSPDYTKADDYIFSISSRSLPLLPLGDLWVEEAGCLMLLTRDGTRRLAITEQDVQYHRDQARRYTALVEEYETRSKSI